MRLNIVLMATALLSAASAQPTDVSEVPSGMKYPHGMHHIRFHNPADHIGNNTNATNALTTRTGIEMCDRIFAWGSACVVIGTPIISGIASAIKAQSNAHTCASTKGTIDDMTYEYFATGKNCDTTAELKTIKSTLKRWFSVMDNDKVCGTQCMDMSHYGTWTGYLKIAPSDQWDESIYCGPNFSFDKCEKDGKIWNA